MGLGDTEVRYPPVAASNAGAGGAVIPRNLTPPASPPLRANDFDIEAGKDRPAGSSVLPSSPGLEGNTVPSPGISRSNTTILYELNATTPQALDSEYDPLLLRTKLLGDEEIELRRRNTKSKSRSSGKKVGKYAGIPR
jgi:hypothetical protein